MLKAAAEPATAYARTYHGTADQVGHMRKDVARFLHGCPAADDAILIADELAANAVTHSDSAGESFTVRVERQRSCLRIEVEDLGGPWRDPAPDGRPHGLDIVGKLTGPGGWGTRRASGGDRVVWARLDLPS